MPAYAEDPFLRGLSKYFLAAFFAAVSLLPALVLLLLVVYPATDIPWINETAKTVIPLIGLPIRDTVTQFAAAPLAVIATLLVPLCYQPRAAGQPSDSVRLLNGLGKYIVTVLVVGVGSTAVFLLAFGSFSNTLGEFIKDTEATVIKTSLGVLLAFQGGYLAQLFGMEKTK